MLLRVPLEQLVDGPVCSSSQRAPSPIALHIIILDPSFASSSLLLAAAAALLFLFLLLFQWKCFYVCNNNDDCCQPMIWMEAKRCDVWKRHQREVIQFLQCQMGQLKSTAAVHLIDHRKHNTRQHITLEVIATAALELNLQNRLNAPLAKQRDLSLQQQQRRLAAAHSTPA